jgi:arsenate reductase
MALTLYGIPNCDTVKKARLYLERRKKPHQFHDFKKEGVDAAALERWAKIVGMQTLINTRGTTWRNLDEADRIALTDTKARALMLAHPSLIKRPVLEGPDLLLVGFSSPQWDSLL